MCNKSNEDRMCSCVQVGDVIYLHEDECKLLGDISVGEYVVEDVGDSGGWRVRARKLDGAGRYCVENLMVQFYQCPGYSRSLLSVKIVGCMTRIFV